MAAVFLIFQSEPKRHYAVHELIIRLARQGREARNIHTRHPRHFSLCFGNSLDRMPISTASATSRAALGSPAWRQIERLEEGHARYSPAFPPGRRYAATRNPGRPTPNAAPKIFGVRLLGPHDDNASSKALASLRSRVSKPSVNQP